jgi:hypothetical protein
MNPIDNYLVGKAIEFFEQQAEKNELKTLTTEYLLTIWNEWDGVSLMGERFDEHNVMDELQRRGERIVV